jgi:hypothetical protein
VVVAPEWGLGMELLAAVVMAGGGAQARAGRARAPFIGERG